MGRPVGERLRRVGMVLAAVCVALASTGCEADLGARRSAAVEGAAMVGQAIIAGRYTGLYWLGTGDHAVGELVVEAADCGNEIGGHLVGPDGGEVKLGGTLTGNSLHLAFESSGFSGEMFGVVERFDFIHGTWTTADGQGGAWAALYSPGSLADFPCEPASDIVDELPGPGDKP